MFEKLKAKPEFRLLKRIIFSSRSKKIMGLLAFIFLAVVVTTPMTDLTRFNKTYYDAAEEGESLTAEELADFLKVWGVLLQNNIAGYNDLQLSFGSDNAAQGLPPQLIRWLKTQGWGVERFFHNEQKVLGLVRVAYLEQELQNNLQLKDTLGYSKLKKIIKTQQDRLKEMNPNPQEFELIKINLKQITQILQLNKNQ